MKLFHWYFLICFILYHCANKVNVFAVDPDAIRNVSELITSKGYPLEEHTVLTKDGYLLSVQRIPHGRDNNTQRGNKEVVLLIHGEVGDGKTWFLNPPPQSLGYKLPDAGYDVWIINNRGSTYSRKNIHYTTKSMKFWDYSYDEIAEYDLPAVIDYILKSTGKKALSIVGYSRGTTVSFIMLSELPEYNKKVKLFIALSPVAYTGHSKSAVRFIIPFFEFIKLKAKVLTHGELLPINKASRLFIAKFCEAKVAFCKKIIFAISGKNEEQLNTTRVPLYSAQLLSSTSVNSPYHFVQLYRSKKFRKFDHGLLGNLIKYKQLKPPEYQLSRITAPVALFWSTNDGLADPIDIDILRKQLKSVVFDYKVPDKKYNHVDFILAKNSPVMIHEPLLKLLDKYKS